jgi:ABC-type nitrate/sulfonate/bicarbonate transport system substrate-binding protein
MSRDKRLRASLLGATQECEVSRPGEYIRWLPNLAVLSVILAFVGLACSASGQPSSPAVPAGTAGNRSAVSPGSAQPTTGDQVVPAATATLLPARKISVSVIGQDINYLPHRIAMDKGFYREAGFDPELQIMQGSAAMAALTAGELAFTASGGTTIRAAARGLPVRLVDCHGVRPVYYVALAPGVTSVRELEDKAFAVGDLGSDNYLVAQQVIQKYGVDPSKIEYQGLGSSSTRYAALSSGRVAGAILLISDSLVAHENQMTIVNTINDMPIACDIGVATSLTWIQEHPQEVRNALRAIHRAVELMRSDRAETTRILAEWRQTDVARAELAYDAATVPFTYSTDKGLSQQAIEQAVLYGIQVGEIAPGVGLADVADLSFYP